MRYYLFYDLKATDFHIPRSISITIVWDSYFITPVMSHQYFSFHLLYYFMDLARLRRVITTNVPEETPKSGVPKPFTWIPPATFEPDQGVTIHTINSLAESLSPELREHCDLGNNPVPPDSEAERVLRRMYKFGTLKSATPIHNDDPTDSNVSLAEAMTSERIAARRKKFNTNPDPEMSEERIRARKEKFGEVSK